MVGMFVKKDNFENIIQLRKELYTMQKTYDKIISFLSSLIEVEGETFEIIDEEKINGIRYFYFKSTSNCENIFFRKGDDKEIFYDLDNDEEFEIVLKHFAEKYEREYLFFKSILNMVENVKEHEDSKDEVPSPYKLEDIKN